MKKWFFISIVFLFIAGCASSAKNLASEESPIKTVAVASLAVNSYGNFGIKKIPESLIREHVNNMLEETEKSLAQHWSVKPAESFVSDPEFQKIATGRTDNLVVPSLAEGELPVFTKTRKDLIKVNISPEIARKLCTHLGVDAIVLAYSEWTVDYGSVVPTQKALTKNCVAMYDSTGKKLFFHRKDMHGEGFIGGMFTKTYIDDVTIEKWAKAYNKSFNMIVSARK